MAGLFCGAPSCKNAVGSPAALTGHQKNCDAYRKFMAATMTRNTVTPGPSSGAMLPSLAARQHRVPPKKSSNLKDRKERLANADQSPFAGPSSTAADIDMHSPDLGPPEDFPMDFSVPMPSPEPLPTPPRAPTPQPVTQTGRAKRNARMPARYRDILPEVLAPVEIATPPADKTVIQHVRLIVRDAFSSAANGFGLWRQYLHRPSYDPDSLISLDDLSNQFPPDDSEPSPLPPKNPAASSSSNASTSLLMSWQNNGHTTKSAGQLNSLVQDVLLDPNFKVEDLKGFNAERAEKQAEKDAAEAFPLLNDFQQADVEIEVPSGSATVAPKKFTVPGLYYRSLVSVIKTAFADPLSRHFHLTPFTLFHKLRSTAGKIRVFSELYNSDAFIKEHDNIRLRGALPPNDQGCKREKVIAALMFWSNSTHLANFGTAKLWPVYMLFGNLSKYIHGKPNSGAEHHVAYIPSLPDSVQDLLAKFHTKWATQQKEILTHCRRELMHAVWKHLLDDEFLDAYKYGIVIRCADGIERRVYPRIFTYSADYPENESEMYLMGFVRDISARISKVRKYFGDSVRAARRHIYHAAYAIGSDKVNQLLKETSSVPTLNAFIERLGDDFNLHQMLVVDFMHEFELGVWKNLFTHLIRLLYAQKNGQELVAELNRRYRLMPRFGVDTIQRFSTNASEMKKLGARDFEDLLQCAVPAFDGLFPPEHNERVLKLLFRMAEWHSFAKLRMHTDPTLEHLRRLTPEIGRLVREFKTTTCAEFPTFELPREAAARVRREQREATARAATGASVPDNSASTSAPRAAEKSTKTQKELNLNIYKWHALGDYVPTILLFGPTDAYSTQLGESLHRLVKRMYALTNKRDHAPQIAKRATSTSGKSQGETGTGGGKGKARAMRRVHLPMLGDPLGFEALDVHHCISSVRRKPLDLYDYFSATKGDPAMIDFIPKLQDHLLGRLLNREFDGDTHEEFTPEDRNTIRITKNRIYTTTLLRVNYTTYDVRRDQDVLNPRAQSFVMVRSPETEAGAHPYWYTQILGVFNATVFRVTPTERTSSTIMEFLWVRWLGIEPGYRAGIKKARLPKVGFVPESDAYGFGFLDPTQVIRGSHLIPDFNNGRTNDLLATEEETAARSSPLDTEDWANYYVNIFADRDMLMRYVGGGIGHLDFETVLSGTDIDLQDDNEEVSDKVQPDSEDESSDDSGSSSSDSDSEEEEEEDEGAAAPVEEEDGEAEGQMEEEMDVDGDGFAAF
ncbi:hypothetical protein C8R44DRAFT_880156 [Mycena epipterygia]|nr:hypothetical protein C8R44DRAFT_880156 [Mycena epipterygia]